MHNLRAALSLKRARLCRIPIQALLTICAMAALTMAAQAFDPESPVQTARERVGTNVLQLLGSGDRDDGMPEIILVSPRLPIVVSSPLDIELRFLTTPPSKIVRGSVRVLYGLFDLDITDRLTANAEVTQFGILAKNAVLPAGSHSITIEVSDDRNRIARKTFVFEIKNENENENENE